MRFTIQGPTTIQGSISVAGAKNHALKLFAAALLADQPVRIERVPDIEDVRRMVEILRHMGCAVSDAGNGAWVVDATGCQDADLPGDLVPKLRACLVLLGPLLARFRTALLPWPGGCAIGRRPIDLFLDGFQAFGVTVEEGERAYRFRADELHAARYVFPIVSVTGTEALLLLATRIPGRSVLENAAMEPEIQALAEFLNRCGARITGAGTATITIDGVERLSGGVATCIPDRIETGTFAAFVAACGGVLTITDCDPSHVAVPLTLLERMGARIEVDPARGSIRVSVDHPLHAVSVRTHEYPGFATDLQPPFTIALTQAQGMSLVHETIYEGRLFYIDKLNKMGANIILCDPHRAIVEGPRRLQGTTLESPDLRAGIALLIAAACAHGESTIDNVYQIDRGFANIEERLRAIGVRIERR